MFDNETFKLYSDSVDEAIKKVRGSIFAIVDGNDNLTADEKYMIKTIGLYFFYDKKKLGVFHAKEHKIGLHENFINASKEDLDDLLVHEIAHFLNGFRNVPETPHDESFRDCVAILARNNDEYLRAEGAIKPHIFNMKSKNQKMAERIDKLKALGNVGKNNSEEEAASALLKAQELQLKYEVIEKNNEKIYNIPLGVGPLNALNEALYMIVRELGCFIVKSKYQNYTGHKSKFLPGTASTGRNAWIYEGSGSMLTLELAKYAWDYLNTELPRLWENKKQKYADKADSWGYSSAEKIAHIKISKNSFYEGIKHSFLAKLRAEKKSGSIAGERDLVMISKDILAYHEKLATNLIYGSLVAGSGGTNRQSNGEAYGQGRAAGKNITIRKGVKSNSNALMLE